MERLVKTFRDFQRLSETCGDFQRLSETFIDLRRLAETREHLYGDLWIIVESD